MKLEQTEYKNCKLRLTFHAFMTECPYCKIKMKVDKKPMSFKFSPNVIVQEVTFESCPKCGFECIPEEEYERIRKLLHSLTKIAKKTKIIVV